MTEAAVRAMFAQFRAEGTFSKGLPYGSGHINDTFLIETEELTCHNYILQRVNHKIFKDVAKLMDNIVRVTEHMQKKLLAMDGIDVRRNTLTVIPTFANQPFFKDIQGNYWRMYIYIADTQTYDIVDSAEKAYQGGKAFGLFQRLLADLPGRPLFETIPNFHNVETRMQAFEKAVSEDRLRRVASCREEIAFVRDQAESMKTILHLGREGKIPLRVTHNDTKFNNVLLDAKTHAGLCVIDLDTVMPGYIHYDFSDSIRTVTNTAAEDEKDLSKVSMNMQLFEGYAKGFLEQVGPCLNPVEVAQLAPSANLLAFLVGLRFLTDHIDGDHYFKIHFEGHNLQRSRAQLQLVKSIAAQVPNMAAVIQKIMEQSYGH